MKDFTQKSVLVFLSIIMSFILLEICYRSYLFIVKPVIIYLPGAKALNPGGSGKYRGGYASLDEHGLRNKLDYQALKRKNRILVIGDSVAFGMGVNDDEVFVHHLNNIYKKVDVGFVNLSYPGLQTEWLRVQLAKHHQRFVPYIGIIWLYNINDARLNQEFKDLSNEAINDDYYSKGPNAAENFIWPYLKSPTLLKYVLSDFNDLIIKANAKNNVAWKDYYEMCQQSYDVTSQKAITEKRYIQQIINWCEEAKIPLAFVLVPYTDQFKDGRVGPQKFIKSILSENNIPFLDLMPAFARQQKPIEEYYLPNDHGHFNAEGNKLVASEISRFLKVMFDQE